MNDPSRGRLERCIRDLAGISALPSMCVGRSQDEALEILFDALPTALSCDLVYVALPEGRERASLNGAPLDGERFAAFTSALARATEADGLVVVDAPERLWCIVVDLPISGAAARLVAGRGAPLDSETDRVLVRSAANLVGTTLETARVLEAAKRKDEFLAMLGHELRNPLAPIVTAVELLAQHPEVAHERDAIERNTRHLTRLVDDLLDISRVTRGAIELRRDPVPLAAVLERAIELASPLVSRNAQTLVVTRSADVLVEGDPVRLAQIFGNLLTNAAKFTPAGGRIELSMKEAGGRVRVVVRDEGRGIAREHLSRIFEPFVQVDRLTEAARGGLGLGLAIVKDLVERHGGTISASSDGPGKGSAFDVELPVLSIAHAPTVAEARAPSPSRASGMRVLVVDDNVDVAELVAEALRIHGFETSLAYTASDALETWRRFDPHAAVLDVGLPDVDGYELARTLRAEHGRAPMLIAATGYGQPTDRLRAADAGFDCHFVKPVRLDDLVRVLAECGRRDA